MSIHEDKLRDTFSQLRTSEGEYSNKKRLLSALLEYDIPYNPDVWQ